MEIWSIGTALRNPDRIPSFLNVLHNFEGRDWDKIIHLDYYIELIRQGEINPNKISSKSLQCSQIEARSIMLRYYQDAPMRGRVLFSLFEKLGLIERYNNKLNFTKKGLKLCNNYNKLSKVLRKSLIEWQYIHTSSQWNSNIKVDKFSPFIATINLIDRVNSLSKSKKGISYEEYLYFVKVIDSYSLIEYFSNLIIKSRMDESIKNKHIMYVISHFNNFVNVQDYSDNDIKYFVATNLIDSDNRTYVNLNYTEKDDLNKLIF